MKTQITLLIVATLSVATPASAQNAAAVFSKVSPSVVVVKGKTAQGSGVAVSVKTEGFSRITTIVTNCHVVTGETVVAVTHLSKTGYGAVKSCDSERDIALIELSGEIPIVTTRSAATLTVGEVVYAVGAPRGLDLSISDGIVSQLRREGIANKTTPMIQTTAAISPGSSGGGLFDAKGHLVGVTTLYLKDAQALNFAIPSDWIAQAPKRASFSVNKTVPHTEPSKTASCGWVEVAAESARDERVYYIDRCTIKQQGHFRMMWGLMNYKTQQLKSDIKPYMSTKMRYAYDCTTERSALTSVINYAGEMGQGEIALHHSVLENNWAFRDVPPGGPDYLLREACK